MTSLLRVFGSPALPSAVGISAGARFHCHHAAGADLVVDDDGLSAKLGEAICEVPGDDVEIGSGREAHVGVDQA